MRVHREGLATLGLGFIFLLLLNLLVYWLAPGWFLFGAILSLVLFLFLLSFFRHPRRPVPKVDPKRVYAPADGKVVVIEECVEPEYFQAPRLQISIFMAVTNVHVNRSPLPGEVSYYRYHPGRYRVAWHPKSSLDNERATLVLKTGFGEVLLRQIAGFLARRIVTYPRPGDRVKQGEDIGFIKFGSRVDVLLPPDAEVKVKVGQEVRGNETVLAVAADSSAG